MRGSFGVYASEDGRKVSLEAAMSGRFFVM